MKDLRNLVLLFFIFSIIIVSLAEGQEQQPKNLVITGARLIDGTGAPPLENAVIVITNGKFEAVGTKGKVTLLKEAEVIDVKGKTVIPGLIDTHVHFTYPQKYEEWFLLNDSISSFRSAHFLNRLLMVGITTVRDVASYHNVSIIAKKAFREGLFIGSRPIVVGQGITCTGDHGSDAPGEGGIVVEVDGPAGFRRGVRLQLKAGANLIKVLPPYSREEIEAAVEETHYYGRLVTVHSGHSGLMLGEYYDFVRWAVEIKKQGFQAIKIKLGTTFSKGVERVMKINGIAEGAGIPCMIGCMMETRVGLSAAAHLAYAKPNIQFADLDSCFSLKEDPVIGRAQYKVGDIILPDTPGHGADIDPAFLERCERTTVK